MLCSILERSNSPPLFIPSKDNCGYVVNSSEGTSVEKNTWRENTIENTSRTGSINYEKKSEFEANNYFPEYSYDHYNNATHLSLDQGQNDFVEGCTKQQIYLNLDEYTNRHQAANKLPITGINCNQFGTVNQPILYSQQESTSNYGHPITINEDVARGIKLTQNGSIQTGDNLRQNNNYYLESSQASYPSSGNVQRSDNSHILSNFMTNEASGDTHMHSGYTKFSYPTNVQYGNVKRIEHGQNVNNLLTENVHHNDQYSEKCYPINASQPVMFSDKIPFKPFEMNNQANNNTSNIISPHFYKNTLQSTQHERFYQSQGNQRDATTFNIPSIFTANSGILSQHSKFKPQLGQKLRNETFSQQSRRNKIFNNPHPYRNNRIGIAMPTRRIPVNQNASTSRLSSLLRPDRNEQIIENEKNLSANQKGIGVEKPTNFLRQF